jgi:hypothetical protein
MGIKKLSIEHGGERSTGRKHLPIMNPNQLSFLSAHDSGCEAIGDWTRDQESLGTKIYLVPKLKINQLGTKEFPVPKSFQPPIGCFQQKLIKGNLYWYWRYYDSSNKKKSLYLAKEYSDAVNKAKLIGYPKDAKRPQTAAITAASFEAQASEPQPGKAAWVKHSNREPKRPS